MFAQPSDHSFNDLFNQYVNMETSSTDGNKDFSFPNKFDQIFPLDSFSTECGDQSPIISTTQHTRQSAQDWSKDLWSLSQNTSCSADYDNLAFQDSTQPSAVLESNVELEAPSTGSSQASIPRSTPSTPPKTPGSKAKGGLFTQKTIRRHRDSNDRRGLLRSSQVQKGNSRMAYPEAWAQRLQDFAIHNSDGCLPLSPPPSDILVQQENFPKHTAAQMNHSVESFQAPTEMHQQFDSGGYITQTPAIPMPSPSANALTSQQQRYLNQTNTSTLTPSPPSAGEFFSSPHSTDPQSMSSWNSDAMSTPAFQFTPELQSHDPQTWWSSMPSEVAQRHASYQHMIASPAPQWPIQASANNNDMLQGGLMIQLDPTTSFDMSSSFPSSTIPTTANTQDTNSYSLDTHTPQQYVDSSSFTTPNMPNPSRSPSISPKTNTMPTNGSAIRNGMAMRSMPRRPQSRKSPAQPTSGPKPVKAPSTSPKSGKSATVSFVNFTANDSQKILTGVAPSGSSKTKARREQEARDRRRKLSEAALRAVRKAGGDVEALEAVFC
ncbi:developmental regulatory protein WetA [Aspergillus undulatus]|uniref:developmental regulatory protein WetA n=1 Tax=Aspergillus undulatus TaxID=1810928 RepID=UPI003CCE0F8D